MNIEKMREEFERTNGRDHRRQPPKGNNYIDAMAQADRGSFQKGWKQSRESLVIELPAKSACCDMEDTRANMAIEDCRKAVEATGVKVAP